MPRYTVDQPSSGKPILLVHPNQYVTTSWVTIAEAPDFSVPTSGDGTAEPDPADIDRELRPGEVFIEAPLSVANLGVSNAWVELRILLESDSTGTEFRLNTKVPVPFNETLMLPIQGLRLLKTGVLLTNGGRLQVRGGDAGDGSTIANKIQIYGSAVELEYLDHAPDTEGT